MDQVSQTTLFRLSSQCRGCEHGSLSRSSNTRTSLALGCDLNPNVLKGPPLSNLVQILCPLNGYIPSSYSIPGKGLLSPTADCVSEVVSEPGPGSHPPQVRELGSQPQSRGSPAVRDWIFVRPRLWFFFCPDTVLCFPQPLFLLLLSL